MRTTRTLGVICATWLGLGGCETPTDPEPGVLDVVILPAEPTTVDDLMVAVDASAAFVVRWTSAGHPGDVFETATLPADLTRKGQRWLAEVESVDGAAGFAAVEVVNTPPEVPEVRITPADPRVYLDDLYCAVGAAARDPDGDPVDHTLVWRHGHEVFDASEPVSRDELRVGQEWTCEITPSDGEVEGPVGVATVVIAEAPVGAVDPWIEPTVRLEPIVPVPGELATISYYGAFAGDKDLNVIYGFDGYIDLGLEGSESLELLEYPFDVHHVVEPMTALDGGGFEYSFTWPEDATAIHFYFGDGEGNLDEGGDGQAYHASVESPVMGPWLTWNDLAQPGFGVVVGFRSAEPCYGIVEWGEGEALDRLAVGAEFSFQHNIELLGLSPETSYSYRVVDSAGRISDTFSFTTPPENPVTYEFAVMADMQDSGQLDERWGEVAQAAIDAHPGLAFVMMPGDLPARNYLSHWWRFFHLGRPLMASVPILPALGNHDTPGDNSHSDSTIFEGFFSLPVDPEATSPYYAQSFGNTLLLTLNSERSGQVRVDGEQYQWLAERLDETWVDGERQVQHVFVQGHFPPYSVRSPWGEYLLDHREITSLFEGNVDWVFYGHDHMYVRMLPLRFEAELAPSGSYGLGEDDGVGYIVVPCAGQTLRDQVIAADHEQAFLRELIATPEIEGEATLQSEHGFVTVAIDGASREITTWFMGDEDDPLDPYTYDVIGTEDEEPL